jgi:hypothetical protein
MGHFRTLARSEVMSALPWPADIADLEHQPVARRMGGANGSRECAPDNKLRDTHHVRDDRDRFREALNPSWDLLPDGLLDLPDGQISKNLSSPLCKNILIFRNPKSLLYVPPSRPTEGRHAIVTAAGRDAVDADALLTKALDADGEDVWS